jgi:cell division protein FtsB
VSADTPRNIPKSASRGGRQARSRKILRVALAAIAIVFVVDMFAGDRGLLALLRARREYDELAQAIARQRQDNDRLREEARRLKDDPAAIEELARRDLGLIRRGERVFIVRDLKSPANR